MPNYQIIVDERELVSFIDRVLPEISIDETFYLCLFARNKYCKDVKHIASDKSQLKRFITNKERMFDKIKQLEVPLDSYTQIRKGEVTTIPQEALALYVSPNPRSMLKTVPVLLKKIADLISTQAHGFNLPQEALSAVQKTCSYKKYYNVDFDIPKENFNSVKASVDMILNNDCLTWVETRGGYHVLVDLELIDEDKVKTWYKNISKISGVEMRKDDMLPVPGTYQGGFSPKVLYDFK